MIVGRQDPQTRAAALRWAPLTVAVDRHVVGLAVVVLLEALIFYAHVINQIAPYYPTSFDQVGYLNDSYRLTDEIRRQGWGVLLSEYLHPPATGVSFVVQGALLAYVFGPLRAALLSLNLLYFVALQLMLFSSIRARTRDAGLAWVALALLLSSGTFFFYAGGLYDFRIDFTALCLYGIWLCLVVRSRVFLSLRGSFVIAAVGILLVSLRFFTVLYIGLVFAGLLTASLVAIWIRRSPSARAIAKRRARNIFLSGTLTAVVVFPLLFAARHALYNYYGVLHVIGGEKYIRAAEQGVYTLRDYILYYPWNIVNAHLGRTFLVLAAVAVIASLLAGLTSWRLVRRQLRRYQLEFLAIFLAIVVPVALLTLDISKSPVVGGIVVVPVVLGFTLLSHVLGATGAPLPFASTRSSWWHGWFAPLRFATRARIQTAVRTIVFIVAAGAFVAAASVDTIRGAVVDLERINALNETIFRFAVEHKLERPKISFDRVADYMNLETVKNVGFERLHQAIDFAPRFGHGDYGIFATPRDVAMHLVSDSDIVILTDPLRDRSSPYPMNTKIREYWDDLWTWATQHQVLFYATEIHGLSHYVFVRPLAGVEGLSGGWITSAGVIVNVKASYLLRFPFIVLEGAATYDWLGGEPKPRAVVVDMIGQSGAPIPATLKRIGNSYRIIIDARSAASAQTTPVRIALTFDRFFVPNKLGINADTRELVLWAPLKSEMLAAPPD